MVRSSRVQLGRQNCQVQFCQVSGTLSYVTMTVQDYVSAKTIHKKHPNQTAQSPEPIKAQKLLLFYRNVHVRVLSMTYWNQSLQIFPGEGRRHARANTEHVCRKERREGQESCKGAADSQTRGKPKCQREKLPSGPFTHPR